MLNQKLIIVLLLIVIVFLMLWVVLNEEYLPPENHLNKNNGYIMDESSCESQGGDWQEMEVMKEEEHEIIHQCACPHNGNLVKEGETGKCSEGGCAGEGEMISTMPLPDGGDRKKCCSGLKSAVNYDDQNGDCDPLMDVKVCINCSDGVCGEGENKCNCPEDCY